MSELLTEWGPVKLGPWRGGLCPLHGAYGDPSCNGCPPAPSMLYGWEANMRLHRDPHEPVIGCRPLCPRP